MFALPSCFGSREQKILWVNDDIFHLWMSCSLENQHDNICNQPQLQQLVGPWLL